MRKKGLIVLGVLFLFWMSAAYFLSDAWVEERLELIMSRTVGAQVDIDGFTWNAAGFSAGWSRLAITDPNDLGSNFVETGRAEFDVDGMQLLYGRFIVDKVRLFNFRSGTKRTAKGVRYESLSSQADIDGVFSSVSQNMTDEVGRSTGIDLEGLKSASNVDEVLQSLQLQSLANLSSFQDDVLLVSDRWEAQLSAFDLFSSRSDAIRTKVEGLSLDGLSSVDDFVNTAKALNAIRDEATGLRDEFTSTKKAFTNDLSSLESGLRSIDGWIEQDVQRVQSMVSLPELSSVNAARMLFGSAFVEKVQSALHYFSIGSHYAEKLAPTNKIDSPPRFEGQDISFPLVKGLPTLWIKDINVTAGSVSPSGGGGIGLSGIIQHVTSDQNRTGIPTTFRLIGKDAFDRQYDVQILFRNFDAERLGSFFGQCPGNRT